MQHVAKIIFTILGVLLLATCGTEDVLSLSDISPDLVNGQEIYEADCILCHEGGIEGAHRLDQFDRWQESAAKGFDQLVKNVEKGYRGKYGELPVRGMCPGCSRDDLRDAVSYMLVNAGVMR